MYLSNDICNKKCTLFFIFKGMERKREQEIIES